MPMLIRRFLKDEGGATAVEYGVILAVLFIAVIGAFTLFAGNSTSGFNGAMATITAAFD